MTSAMAGPRPAASRAHGQTAHPAVLSLASFENCSTISRGLLVFILFFMVDIYIIHPQAP